MAAGQKDRWVYKFGPGKADGSAQMRELLGGKGANLAEMSNLGLPVPPGFTISTEMCEVYNERGRLFPDSLTTEVDEAIAEIARHVGAVFGDAQNPLLVSVRSGARASMPGMMDTVLNLGLNDETARGLAAQSGDERFAYDSYRRFIQMYSDVVLGIDHHIFEEILDTFKHSLGFQLDTDLTAEDWRQI
ncbi:MAG TPA: PEP/pyruvate-binding domain-containing protein, partial [Hyphomicrobiales bacterium]|nr:PEP/pyruvate-binding domain-containing protein [Hyphomicrobiales bacterium]